MSQLNSGLVVCGLWWGALGLLHFAMTCEHDLTSSCVAPKTVHMLKNQFLPQMFTTLHLFVLSSIIPTSFSSVLAGFSLPPCLEWCLRVCQTGTSWAPNVTVLGLLTEIGILLIWYNEDPQAINLRQLINAVQIDFSINLDFALRTMCFQASPFFIVSLWFPSGHINCCLSHDQSESGNCHFGEFRAASFEIYSLPVQLRIQFLTSVRGSINTYWTMKIVMDVWMCV